MTKNSISFQYNVAHRAWNRQKYNRKNYKGEKIVDACLK